MTLPRLFSFNRYWEHHPPTHIMVARLMGIKPGAPAQKKASPEEMLAEFAGMGFEVG
jgi:hypothetical protein